MYTGVKVPCLNRLAIPLCCRSFPAVIERKDGDHAAYAVVTGAGVEPGFPRFPDYLETTPYVLPAR